MMYAVNLLYPVKKVFCSSLKPNRKKAAIIPNKTKIILPIKFSHSIYPSLKITDEILDLFHKKLHLLNFP